MLEEIEEAAERFCTLERVPIGLCVIRRDFTVLFWNRILEQWTKIPKQKIIGTNLKTHFLQIDQPKYQTRLEQVFKNGLPALFSPQLHQSLPPTAKFLPCKLSPGGWLSARPNRVGKR